MQKKIPLLFLSLVLFLGSLGAIAAEADIKKAEELMRQGKPAEAYSILAPLAAKNAGNVDFDYLLGIAALDSGKPDEALNAFERVLAVNPVHLGARLDMARAYFSLGALDLAKQEFERVRAANPPEAARNVVDQHLAAIEQRYKERLHRFIGYLEAGAGYDDNITSVTASFQGGTQQAFGAPFTPTGNAIRRKAGFYTIGGGVDYGYALTDTLAFLTGFDFRLRYHDSRTAPIESTPRPVAGDAARDNSAFDSQTLGGKVGLSLNVGKNVFVVNLQTQQYRQDGDTPINPGESRRTSDRDTDSLAFQWSHSLTTEAQVGAFVQYANNRFTTNDTQDTNQTTVGLTYAYTFQRPGNPQIFASLYKAVDNALRPLNPPVNSTDVSKTVNGLRLYGQYTPKDNTDVYAGISYSRRDDDTAFSRSTIVPFGTDNTQEVLVGLIWRFAPQWSVRGQLQHTKNDSNLSLYSFKRTEALMAVRRDFR